MNFTFSWQGQYYISISYLLAYLSSLLLKSAVKHSFFKISTGQSTFYYSTVPLWNMLVRNLQ